MLDSGFLFKNWETVAPKLLDRGVTQETLDNFKRLSQEARKSITEAERLKARHNVLSEQVGVLKKSGQDAAALMEEIRFLKEEFDKADQVARDRGSEMLLIIMNIPNLTRDEVPIGESEEKNEVQGKPWWPKDYIKLNFTPKPHWELGEALGILDLERAAKISGARFAVYMGAGARLERALINFMLDMHTAPRDGGGHGYKEVLPPFMVNKASLFGTGQMPKFAEDLFRCADADWEERSIAAEEYNKAVKDYGLDSVGAQYARERLVRSEDKAIFNDHWLIPTAEVPVTNLYRDEILDEARLPICLTAYTPCFRAEAGAAGKDTRGIIRQHQFQKVELVKFTRPEDSDA